MPTPGPQAACTETTGGVCDDTEDAGEVEAKCETCKVSETRRGMDGLGMTRASLGIGMQGASKSIAELELELALLELW